MPIATFWSSSWEPEAEGAFKVAPSYLFEKHEFF